MANERKALLIRLPEDLHEALRQLASADLRSVNAEIEYLLREAIMRRRGVGENERRDGVD